ncbi:MAG: phage terminase large subunit [Candidatus Nitrosotenuis sp.]
MAKLFEFTAKFQTKQEEALKLLSRYPVLFYGGAKGGGKSYLVRTWQILRRLKYPDTRGLLIRKTYPQLYENHVLMIFKEHPHLKNNYNKFEKIFYFPNGSTLTMGHLENPADVYNYFGREYEDIAIDEAQEHTETVMKVLRSSNRTTNPNIKPRTLLTGNPGGIGHGWLKRIFIDRQFKEEENPADFAFLQAKVWDNPRLVEADPDYVKRLQSLPTEERRAYLEGDWDIFAGQVFGEWRREKHVSDRFEWQKDQCRKIITYDWGYNAPGCALWLAFSPENQKGVGRCFVYRELYQSGKTPEEWAKSLKTLVSLEKPDFMVLPHDCFSKLGGRTSIASVFQKELGIPIVAGRTLQKDARKNRLAITHQYLSDAPDGKPYLLVHPNCKNLIRTLPELVYSETNPEDVDTRGEDHAYDALSLGLVTVAQGIKGSGGVKTTQPYQIPKSLAGQPLWVQTPEGEITSPDFATAFKEAVAREKPGNPEFK